MGIARNNLTAYFCRHFVIIVYSPCKWVIIKRDGVRLPFNDVNAVDVFTLNVCSFKNSAVRAARAFTDKLELFPRDKLLI